MPRNKIEDLRNHLFEAIEMVKDGEMEMDKAKAINSLSKTLVDSAKVEVSYLKVLGKSEGTGFFPVQENQTPKAIEE